MNVAVRKNKLGLYICHPFIMIDSAFILSLNHQGASCGTKDLLLLAIIWSPGVGREREAREVRMDGPSSQVRAAERKGLFFSEYDEEAKAILQSQWYMFCVDSKTWKNSEMYSHLLP